MKFNSGRPEPGEALSDFIDRTEDDVQIHRNWLKKKREKAKIRAEKKITKIKEDAPVNAGGNGNIAGLGVGPMGEPGVKRRNKKNSLRSSSLKSPKLGPIMKRTILEQNNLSLAAFIQKYQKPSVEAPEGQETSND